MRGHGERADAGSTLVSSLVTVLVLTLVVATGAGFLRQTGRVALRLQEQALFSVQAARLEDTLINALARVAQPRSLPEPALRSAPGLLELPWFGGEEGQTLRL